MMSRTIISQLAQHLGETVTIKGWAAKIRDLGGVRFILVRDYSGSIQVVVESQELDEMRIESVIGVVGKVVSSPRAPGGIEIQAEKVAVIAAVSDRMLPFEVNRETIPAGLDIILNHRALSLRNEKTRAVFRVQHRITEAFRRFFTSQRFTEIHTPKIVASGTEGGTELFSVDYFGRKAFLAQSPQLYKQMMVGAGFERVFEVGHAYRAELHDTGRHINEYVSLDAEMGFIENEADLMDIETEFLKTLFAELPESCADELALYGVSLPAIDVIPRLTLEEARQTLKSVYGKGSPVGNLDPEGEKLICDYAAKEFGSELLFVTKYPVAKRPFYAMPDSADGKLTNSFDLLYKGLEITTGGQRIHQHDRLVNNITKFGLNPEGFASYLETFAFGMPPHGGFAIGLERLTMKVLGLSNIREATLLPRDRSRLMP